jgi:hypothetical protein
LGPKPAIDLAHYFVITKDKRAGERTGIERGSCFAIFVQEPNLRRTKLLNDTGTGSALGHDDYHLYIGSGIVRYSCYDSRKNRQLSSTGFAIWRKEGYGERLSTQVTEPQLAALKSGQLDILHAIANTQAILRLRSARHRERAACGHCQREDIWV